MKIRKFKLDKYEIGIILNALLEFRNSLISVGKHTDAVDEFILKL